MIFFAWVIAGLGIGAVLFGWFWDRPGFRGRAARRCEKCWYDLSDSGELPITCPECGYESKSERSMRRVRRQKKVVAVGLVLVLASPVVGLASAYQRGALFAKVPTGVLVEILPFFPTLQDDPNLFTKGNNPGVEVVMRIAGARKPMSHEEIVDMLRRMSDGNWFARPGSKKWQETTATWMRGQWDRFWDKDGKLQYPDEVPSDEALERVMAEWAAILPKWYPHTRDAWPVGLDALIRSGLGDAHWLRLRRSDERLEQEVHWKVRGTDISGSNLHGGYFGIPNEFPVGQEIVVDLTYKLYRTKGRKLTEETKGEVLNEERFALRWKVVADVDDAIEVVDNPTIREILTAVMIPELAYDFSSFSILQNPTLEEPALDWIGMSTNAMLLDGDVPIVVYRSLWMTRNGNLSSMSTQKEEFVPHAKVGQRISEARENDTLRILLVGDPGRVLEIFDAKRAWGGKIDILYSEAIKIAESSEYAKTEGKEKAP